MLETLHRLATSLSGFKPLVIAGILIFSALAVFGLFTTTPETESLLNSSILGTIWTLLIFSFLQLFQSIPPHPATADGFFKSLCLRTKRGLYYLLSLLMISTTLALLWMSLRLIML